jgi:hypothetical protein
MFIGRFALGFAAKKLAPCAFIVPALIASAAMPRWAWWIDRHREVV